MQTCSRQFKVYANWKQGGFLPTLIILFNNFIMTRSDIYIYNVCHQVYLIFIYQITPSKSKGDDEYLLTFCTSMFYQNQRKKWFRVYETKVIKLNASTIYIWACAHPRANDHSRLINYTQTDGWWYEIRLLCCHGVTAVWEWVLTINAAH